MAANRVEAEPLSWWTRAAAGPVATAGILLLAACSASEPTVAPTPKANSAMCIDALALPIRSAAQLLLDPERLPELRNRAFAVLESTAENDEITAAAHDVALKTVAVIDVAEATVDMSGDPLAMLGSGMDALSELAQPLDELMSAETELTEVCVRVVGPVTPSPSSSSAVTL